MRGLLLRYTVTLCVVSASAVMAARFSPGAAQPVAVDIRGIPLEAGRWRGRELPVERQVKAILETEGVIMRAYDDGAGHEVGLAVVYYPGNSVALHLPESCLSGHGSRLVGHRERLVIAGTRTVRLTQMMTRAADGTGTLIMYYFQAGDHITRSYLSFRRHMLLSRLRGARCGGALVRYTAPAGNDTEAAAAVLEDFIGSMAGCLGQFLR